MSFYPRGIVIPTEMQAIRRRTSLAMFDPQVRADVEALISSHEHLRARWLLTSNRVRLQEQEIEALRLALKRLEAERTVERERGRNHAYPVFTHDR